MTTSLSQFVRSPWLTAVRVVSTSNIAGTYNNGPANNGVGATLTVAASSLTVDSVVLSVGDRVLLQTQTNTNEQGVYIVESITSVVVLMRAEDMQDLEAIRSGFYVSVGAGSVNAGSFFTVIEPLPSVLGLAPLLFSADPASGAAVTFSGAASTANALAVFSNTSGDLKAASGPTTLGQALAVTGNLSSTANLQSVNLLYGATPVAQVDPASCTITAAAGASNHCTITVQLKDGSGTNMARTIPFKVYLATDATGLVLQTAASTGYSVTSGGVVDPTGSTTVTHGLAAFSSATGGCVLDLLDTGKGTGNLILMLPNGFKASAAITSGSYGA